VQRDQAGRSGVRRSDDYCRVTARRALLCSLHGRPGHDARSCRALNSADKRRGFRITDLTKTPCAARRTSGTDPRLPGLPDRDGCVVGTVRRPQSTARFCSQYTPNTLGALESGPRSPQHARASHGLQFRRRLIDRDPMGAQSSSWLLRLLRSGVKFRPCCPSHGHSARG